MSVYAHNISRQIKNEQITEHIFQGWEWDGGGDISCCVLLHSEIFVMCMCKLNKILKSKNEYKLFLFSLLSVFYFQNTCMSQIVTLTMIFQEQRDIIHIKELKGCGIPRVCPWPLPPHGCWSPVALSPGKTASPAPCPPCLLTLATHLATSTHFSGSQPYGEYHLVGARPQARCFLWVSIKVFVFYFPLCPQLARRSMPPQLPQLLAPASISPSHSCLSDLSKRCHNDFCSA